MKLVYFVLATFFSAFAWAGEATPGQVLCSLTSPVTTGFQVVNVRAKDRPYQGSADVGNLRISGSYQSSDSQFSLSISSIDDDGMTDKELLFVESRLRKGEFWHSRAKNGSDKIEIYCYFIQSL